MTIENQSPELQAMQAPNMDTSAYAAVTGMVQPGRRVTSYIERTSPEVGDVRTLFSYELDTSKMPIQLGVTIPALLNIQQSAFFLNMLWHNLLIGSQPVQIRTLAFNSVFWPSDIDSVVAMSMTVENIGSTNATKRMRLASCTSIRQYLANNLTDAVITLVRK